MVFQRPAPFAGSVAHNVRVAFLGKKLSGAERRARVGEALERFKIDHLAEHRAATLSGGELRRLALSRAFALRPAVLLLDEPFAALDADGQAALSLDLRRAISDTGVAVAMVTHDLRRAMLLADRIAVLLAGKLAQVGRRDDVLERPSTPEIARVVGDDESRSGRRWHGIAAATSRWSKSTHNIASPHIPNTQREPASGSEFAPSISSSTSGAATWTRSARASCGEMINDGVSVSVGVDWAGSELRTHLMAGRGLARSLEVGAEVSLSASPEHVHLMPVRSD